MAVASPVDVAVNPNNSEQRYILWGNGRIDAIGGAVPITGHATWFHRTDQPIVVAFHILNWTTGAGYMLDMQGGFHPLNGASVLTIGDEGAIAGVPYTAGHDRKYVDMSMDPAGTGQGYALDQWGQLYNFGGATAPPRTGRRYTTPRAIALSMRWTPSKLGVQLEWNGRLYPEFGVTAVPNQGEIVPTRSAFRDLVVTDWSNTAAPKGYKLTLYGSVRSFGGATVAYGWKYNPGGDVGRTLAVLNSSDPLQMWSVWAGGQQYEWTSSTPPTVTAGGSDPVSPAATVTTTTRPDLLWDYSDPQKDSQAQWQLLVFTQTWVTGHSMTDPLLWKANALVAREGTDPHARGIECPVDLPNGSYRLYVRAQDSAGDWSAWDDHAWTQNVPAPTTPTSLTATPNQTSHTVTLQVTATTGGSANLIRFESSDDAGVTWVPVVGADAVTLASTTIASDRFPPHGKTRQYRAVAYAIDPRVASAPSNVASATMTALVYSLRALDDSSLGGAVSAQEPSEWSRASSGGVFWGLGAEFPTVVTDGRPKARQTVLHVITESVAEWDVIERLAESDSVLVYRDPFGEVIFCRLVGDWQRQLARGAVDRHIHTSQLPLVEVAPPLTDA